MNRRPLRYLSVLTLLAVGLTAALPAAAEPRVVTLETDDTMQFSVARIEAAPGEEITVVLDVRSSLPATEMAHNWVLLAPGTDVGKFVMASVVARDSGYIAPGQTGQVLAMTALAGGGETVRVTFDAPREPGEYPYVCTFPGHFWGGMKGVLVVS